MVTLNWLFHLRMGWLLGFIFFIFLLSMGYVFASNSITEEFSSLDNNNNTSFKYIKLIHDHNESLNQDPNNAEAWFGMGIAEYQLRRYNESIEDYNKSLNINPNNAEAWFGRGLARYQQKRYDESIDDYNKSLNINPNNAEAWFGRGLARYQQKRYDKSIEDYNKSLNISSENAETWYFRGLARYWQDDYDKSISDFDKSLSVISRGIEAWNYKGLNLYNESYPGYDRSLNIRPINAEAWYYRGLAHYLKNNYTESIHDFNASLDISSNNGDAWLYKGLAHFRLNEYDKSIQDFDKSLNLATPEVTLAWYNKGKALYEINRTDEAIAAYNMAIENNKSFKKAWYNKGNALLKEKKFEEAISAYDNATIIDENYKEAWNNKAYSLQELNRSAESYIAYAKSKDIDSPKELKRNFILFLILYILLSTMSYIFSEKFIISTEVLAFFTNLLGFLACAWLFSELYYYDLTKLTIIYIPLAIGITFVFWISLGLPLEDLWQRMVKAFIISRKNIGFYHMIIRKLCIISIVSYLIISSVFYCRLVDSEDGMLHFLELAIALILLVNLAVALPYIVNMLLSVRIDHDTRNILLILQFGYLCLNALLLSALLWIFGISQSVLSLSPFLLGIMILMMVLLFLFPYFSGWQREKRWHELLLIMRLEWIDELLDIFEFPIPSHYATKLQRLSLQIEDSIGHYNEDETKTSNTIDKGGQAKRNENIYEHAFRQNEPYASHQDFLRKIHENIIECTTQLRELSDEDELLKYGRAYAELYRQRRKDISDRIEQEKNSKPFLWIGLTVGLTSITATVLTVISGLLGSALRGLLPIPK